MEYYVHKLIKDEWVYEGKGNIQYVNKMIEFYTLKNGIQIDVMEVKKTTKNSIVLNILNTCLELKDYGVDAFFDYSPHIQAIGVRVHINGWMDSESEDYEEPVCLDAYLEKDFIPEGNLSVKGLEEELVRILSEVKNDR